MLGLMNGFLVTVRLSLLGEYRQKNTLLHSHNVPHLNRI